MTGTRPRYWIVLILILSLHAFSAIGGGFVMVLAPDGSLLQITPELLEATPFSSYLVPGLILLILLGLVPVFILYGLISLKDLAWTRRLNLYPDRHWSWAFTIYLCIAILTWIFIELLMLRRFDPLMSVVGLWSNAMLVLILSPAMQRYYTVDAK